ncbi:MAG: M14 family metallopeptidase [Candidatus Bathyarchaeia archaeon]
MKKIIVGLLLISLCSLSIIGTPQAYGEGTDTYKLVKVYLNNIGQYAEIATTGFDVIKATTEYLEVFASQEQISWLTQNNFKTEEMDLAEVVDQTAAGKADVGLYHTYAEAQSELYQIEQAHGSIAKVYVIGKSLENRDIMAIKISDNPQLMEPSEPAVLYMGCHHAREWISVEMPMNLAHYLVDNYGTDANVTKLVNERETWIVPIVNPDGLVYSQTSYTMWRKNKRDNNGNGIFDRYYDGVDVNRNYGYKWGYDDVGSSWYPGDETYRGASAFSEPETQAIRALALQYNFVLSVSFHSYGETMIFPWGYANLDTPDDALFNAIGAKMAVYNGYVYGNAKDGVIYNTNGDSDDWLYGERGTLAYTFEVATQFIPPENQIEPIWQENKNASLYLLEIADNPRQIFPSFRIYTDKTNYNVGEPMQVHVRVKNLAAAAPARATIKLVLPDGSQYGPLLDMTVTIPAGYDSGEYLWNQFTIPSVPSGNYQWVAELRNPSTGTLISQSIWRWQLLPS